MKTPLRLPATITEFAGDPILSNHDNLIRLDVEQVLISAPFFSRFSAWDFNGKVWWDDAIGYWIAEVWVKRKYEASYLAETLEELAFEINTEHGHGESTGYFSRG